LAESPPSGHASILEPSGTVDMDALWSLWSTKPEKSKDDFRLFEFLYAVPDWREHTSAGAGGHAHVATKATGSTKRSRKAVVKEAIRLDNGILIQPPPKRAKGRQSHAQLEAERLYNQAVAEQDKRKERGIPEPKSPVLAPTPSSVTGSASDTPARSPPPIASPSPPPASASAAPAAKHPFDGGRFTAKGSKVCAIAVDVALCG
jgi:hypothetical protein